MYLQFHNYQNQYNRLNGGNNMHISQIDLCRHTMQVGYKDKSSFLNASLYKHFQLFFMIMANVDYIHGELVLKDGYFDLERSEKNCVSYQIGQGLTKAVAENYFDSPWVAHFNTIKNLHYKFQPSGSAKIIIDPNVKTGIEPDLIGYDKTGNVHIFESKGTSAKYLHKNSIQKAINQASEYIYIYDNNGNIQNFTTRNACLFNFTPCFSGRVIDPPIDNESYENSINIGLLGCLYNYYYHFLYNEREYEIINEFNRKWNGYIFSFGNEKYFWGINSLYKEFLREQLDNRYSYDNYSVFGNKDENILKIRKILNFFKEEDSGDFNYNDDVISIGKDGCILCNLNKI